MSVDEAAASNPGTDPLELVRLAHEHPELRALVAANPSTYSGLLHWLGQFDDPAIDAAIARRRGAGPPEPAPVASVPPTLVPPSPDARWHEPARDIPLHGPGYGQRYATALGLLGLGLLLPPSFAADAGALAPVLIPLALGVAGLAVVPATVPRRLVAGVLIVPISATGLIAQALGDSISSLLVVPLALAVWLVLRQRSSPSYLLLLAGAALGAGAAFAIDPLVVGLVQVGLVFALAWAARLVEPWIARSRSRSLSRRPPEVQPGVMSAVSEESGK